MKVYNLKKGDKARHGKDGELLSFRKMDGMYAQWENKDGEIKIGHSDEYNLGEDGVYYTNI